MKESWRYYDYLRRWGIFLLIGIALGALAGFGFNLQQKQQQLFKASSTAIVSGVPFTVVSREYSTPKEAVESLLSKATRVREKTNEGIEIEVGKFSIEGRYRAAFWKPLVMGSVIGGLLALGAGYVWDDAAAYRRHLQKIKAKDS